MKNKLRARARANIFKKNLLAKRQAWKSVFSALQVLQWTNKQKSLQKNLRLYLKVQIVGVSRLRISNEIMKDCLTLKIRALWITFFYLSDLCALESNPSAKNINPFDIIMYRTKYNTSLKYLLVKFRGLVILNLNT